MFLADNYNAFNALQMHDITMTKKTLDAQDSTLFRQTVGKVQTVKQDKIPIAPVEKPKPYPQQRTRQLQDNPLDRQLERDADLDTVGQEDSLRFLANGLQHNVLKKMRKGHFGVDAEMDLHGLNTQEAKRQLLHFLHSCVEDGCRCVHIVHGKGYRSLDNQPILKNQLNLWLRQHKDVQAFCSAAQKEGGTGAVLVLLQLSEKYRTPEEQSEQWQ
jgi:DNA-nicking Smr family endonuclease